MEQGERTAARLQALDLAFFEELVALTGNRVLMLLANAIRHVYLERPELFAMLYEPEAFDTTPHRETVRAIEARAEQDAQRAMEKHALSGLGRLEAVQSAHRQGGPTP